MYKIIIPLVRIMIKFMFVNLLICSRYENRICGIQCSSHRNYSFAIFNDLTNKNFFILSDNQSAMQLFVTRYSVLFSRLFVSIGSNDPFLLQEAIKMQRQVLLSLPSWTQIRRACVTLLSIPRGAALLFRATMPPFSPSSSSSSLSTATPLFHSM